MRYTIQTTQGERVVEEQDGKLIDIGSKEEIDFYDNVNKEEKIKQEIEERIKWEKDTIAAQMQTIPEEDIPPAYINGVPYYIIDGKYVPLEEGKIIFQERKIKKEKEKLNNLTGTQPLNAFDLDTPDTNAPVFETKTI